MEKLLVENLAKLSDMFMDGIMTAEQPAGCIIGPLPGDNWCSENLLWWEEKTEKGQKGNSIGIIRRKRDKGVTRYFLSI